jgi:hypothetical protein
MGAFKVIDDRNIWYEYVKEFENPDIYYSYEYGEIFAQKEQGKILAAYYENDGVKIFYPFIKRAVNNEFYDIVTPYGYGGPLVQGEKKSIKEFNKHFKQYCLENGILTEVIRFHPLIENHDISFDSSDVQYIRKTTAVDLSGSLEEIRSYYTPLTKRNIRKARKNNVSCYVAEKSMENIRKFQRIYNEAMDRNEADDYYYFNEKELEAQLKDTPLSKNYLLFARHNNQIIAGIILFIGKEFGHYHLGGSLSAYLKLRPNNLLFDFMIEIAREQGVEKLHLGGGYQEEDGLFNFKSSFTNSNHYDYFMGKMIHNNHEYDNLLKKLKLESSEDGFFPIYRSKKALHKLKEVSVIG